MAKKIWLGRAAWVLLVIISGLAGYAVGAHQWYLWATDMLQHEVKGTLVQRVEELSFLRMGDVDGAVKQLEQEADLLTIAIAQSPSKDKTTLRYMKTYLSVVPPSPERARTLSPYLEGVPRLNADECATALTALMRSREASGK